MQEEPETFVEQLQDAVNRGLVVLVTAPARPPAPPPLHARDETSLAAAACLTFNLRLGESRMLMKLMASDFQTKPELRDAASCDGRTITFSTVDVYIASLRKKLQPYGVRVGIVPKLGYGISAEDRNKILTLLAGAVVMSTTNSDDKPTQKPTEICASD